MNTYTFGTSVANSIRIRIDAKDVEQANHRLNDKLDKLESMNVELPRLVTWSVVDVQRNLGMVA